MIAFLFAASLAVEVPAPACPPAAPKTLALDVRSFDQALGSGWRPLADAPGCEGAAADLIAAYRRTHAAALVEGPLADIRSLNWHEAQLRAAAGQTAAAIALFTRARPDVDAARSLYAEATLAFLRRDRGALQAACVRLAALPKPEGWDAAVLQVPPEHRPVWPQNLAEVDGLLACFDKPYAQAYAYAYACRPKPAR